MNRSVAVIAITLLLLPWSVQAQDSEPMLSDGDGDLEMEILGQQGPTPNERYGYLDLEALDIVEVPEGFEVTLTVAGFPSGQGDASQSGRYRIEFQYGGFGWHLGMYRDTDALGQPFYFGDLRYVEGDDTWGNFVAYYDVVVDEASGTMQLTMLRDDLFDVDGKPPSVGDVLADFAVTAQGLQANMICTGDCIGMSIHDRMPDEGVAGIVEVALGVAQEGDAILASEAPFRVSNGGATTIVYQVTGVNFGERQSFQLGLEGVPEGWEVSLPFDRIVIEEDDDIDFPILLTTPSGHNHGGAEKFLLTMQGERDSADIGRIELGLRYTDIPQPAGHHPRLYLHAFDPWGGGILGPVEDQMGGMIGGGRMGYFNALEDDPGDLDMPVYPWGSGVIPGLQSWFRWDMPLMPNLQIGLDFDPDVDGTITIPVQYDYIAQDVVMRGTLNYYSETRDIEVGQILESSPASWGPGLHEFELTIDIAEDADFIEFQPEAYLYLELEMEGTFIGVGPFGPGATPAIMPNGFMDLPLNEYRDPVDDFYRAVESLSFGEDYLERLVNPAETAIFETKIRNVGNSAETVVLNITGVNDEWATILGAQEFELAKGESRDIAIAVTIPAGTPDGALADMVLQAVSKDDAYKRAVLDLIAIVDEEEDHPDDAAEVQELQDKLTDDKKSPGFEIAAVMAGLLAIVLVLRRRR